MSNCIDAVSFAYTDWRNDERWGRNNDASVSPQGYGPIQLNEDALPFLKIALIRHYCNVHGNDSFDAKKQWES